MRSAGLTLTRQAAANSSGAVDIDDRPPSAIWADLATSDGFQRTLVDAVRELLAGTHHADRARVLREAGVTAAHGGYATVATGLDRPIETVDKRTFADEHPDATQAEYHTLRYHADALELTAAFGQSEPSILGHRLPLESVRTGPLAILDAADRTPTVTLRVRRSFRDRRAEHRRQTCRLVAWLAEVADVRLVAGRVMQAWLAYHYRAELPGGVSEQIIAGRNADPDEALASLDPEGDVVALLRNLTDEPTETLTYHELYDSATVSKDRIRQRVKALCDLGLAARFGPQNRRCVELLPAGREVVETFDAEIGRQQSLQDSISSCESGVYSGGQSNSQYTCTKDAHGETAPLARREPNGGLAESAVPPPVANHGDRCGG